MTIQPREGNAESLLRCKELPSGSIGLAWLGQAGFLVKYSSYSLLIDPYLSDSLAQKYRGSEFAHERAMPVPVKPEDVHDIDAVFCTHRHGDHMDPGTLPTLAENNPRCRFFIPRAELDSAISMGLPRDRIAALNAGDVFRVSCEIRVTAVPSAHEALMTNDRGEHHYLGYIFRLGNHTVYHSGDCVPYEGLNKNLAEEHIDVALLPINGRDEFRRSRGVPGNMTFEEAFSLCRDAAIPLLVPHHFGMFAFNTVDPQTLAHNANVRSGNPRILLPNTGSWLELRQ